MSRTTTANRVPHAYEEDPEAPGCCVRCQLPAANRIHDPWGGDPIEEGQICP